MISNIIELLVSDENLTKPLLNTLVFARRIANEELASWASNELNGYNNTDILPAYRYARTTLSAVMNQNGQRTKQVTLPLSCFSQETIDLLIKKPFSESIAGLEAVLSNPNNKYIIKNYAADMLLALSNDAKKNGHVFGVVSCQQIVSVTEVNSIIISVKTKLLNLLLKIEKSYPNIDEINADPGTKSAVNSIVNFYMSTIYNIESNGNAALINTGNQNHIQVTTKMTKGDLPTLKNEFLSNGIQKEDVDEIAIILTDEIAVGNKLGERTKQWTTKMLGKAVNETWNMPLGKAATLLEQAINNYYGLK